MSSTTSVGPGIADKIKEGMTGNGFIMVLFLASIGCYVGSFLYTSSLLGNQDEWINIKGQVWSIFGWSIGGLLITILGTCLYFYTNPDRSVLAYMLISCVALCLSFAALAVACITRVPSQ
jgi:uncharacterized membrane protein YeaQ/YmgE (transglycosylase-associated protein family)